MAGEPVPGWATRSHLAPPISAATWCIGQRIGVTHADADCPRNSRRSSTVPPLTENTMVRVRAGHTDVLLVRQHGRVCALVHACAHLGGPFLKAR